MILSIKDFLNPLIWFLASTQLLGSSKNIVYNFCYKSHAGPRNDEYYNLDSTEVTPTDLMTYMILSDLFFINWAMNINFQQHAKLL